MLVTLTMGIIPTIYAFNHPNPYHSISAFCKARSYVLQSSAMTYRWFMAIACIDRYIYSSPDLRRQQLVSIRLTTRVIGVTGLLWFILPFHQLVWNDVQNNLCVFINTSVGIYNSFFTIVLGGLLPPLIMLICALLIQKNLVHRRVLRDHTVTQHTITGDQQKQLLRSRDRQALSMLYLQAIVYTLSNIPWTLNLLYTAFTRSISKTTDVLIVESFIRSLCELIVFLYPALSFYMYTLISRTFREELMKLLCLNRRVRPLV